MRSLLQDYKDIIVYDLLEYGFQIEFEGDRSKILQSVEKKDICKYKNHKGAENVSISRKRK